MVNIKSFLFNKSISDKMEQIYSQRELDRSLNKKDVKENLEEIFLRNVLKGSIHGYGFMRYIRKEFEVALSASEVYPIMHSLAKRGIVHSQLDVSGEKPRRVYQSIPIVTLNYLEKMRKVKSRNRMKINKACTRIFEIELPKSLIRTN